MAEPIDRSSNILKMIEEQRRFIEEVLAENDALRKANLGLKTQISDGKPGDGDSELDLLRHRLAVVEHEKNTAVAGLDSLKRQLSDIEAENRQFVSRFLEIEQRNGNLASLYVASYNLHATLDFTEVVTCIKEILINLVGAETFGIYVLGDQPGTLSLLAHEGLGDPEHQTIPRDAQIDGVLRTGLVRMAFDSTKPGEASAHIPLRIKDRELGVIIIYALLRHITDVSIVDRELLELLSAHAATALYAAQLYGQTERRLSTLRDFLGLLKNAPTL